MQDCEWDISEIAVSSCGVVLRVVTTAVPVEDVGVMGDQRSRLNCRAAEERDVAGEIVEGGTVLGKLIEFKNGYAWGLHILIRNFRRDRVLLKMRRNPMMMICFFCVSCFVGEESPVL